MMNNASARPTLSIVVNNYNYGRFLAAALDSALEQLADGDELVVVDDGSTDDSRQILERYADRPEVQVIAQANSGQMNAVRTGINAAGGQVLVLLDSDDELLPGYLQRLRQIYSDEPAVSFVSSKPQLGGDGVDRQRKAHAWLDRIELEPGVVGSTRWATTLFYEFVGVPTSGNSMRRELARKIMALPSDLDARRNISPALRRLLGISEAQARNSGLTADGFMVRAASLLGAVKYYDDRPGFLYRIHAGNRFAHTPWLGRWYLRARVRRKLMRATTCQFELESRPSAADLRSEILQRHFGRLRGRRIQIRALYCLALLRCSGSPGERLAALGAALGLTGRKRSSA